MNISTQKITSREMGYEKRDRIVVSTPDINDKSRVFGGNSSWKFANETLDYKIATYHHYLCILTWSELRHCYLGYRLQLNWKTQEQRNKQVLGWKGMIQSM